MRTALGVLGVLEMRVYKVGGSLFDWPGLRPALTDLLHADAAPALLIAGGGAAADAARTWDRAHGLGPERSHELALRAMGLGVSLLAALLPDAVVVSTRDEADRVWAAKGLPVLDAAAFLAEEESAGATALPRSWDVTSDSIAAFVAARWPADLTLCKSTTPGPEFVDAHFPQAATQLSDVAWINLRTGDRGQWDGGRWDGGRWD